MRSFVIGNGKSRLRIDLKKLKEKGLTYGCNALYREFNPDFLITVDDKMIAEIDSAGYQHTGVVWTNQTKKMEKYKGFFLFNPSLGWSSGPSALHLATTHFPTEIFMIGFDFVGINGKVNNVYADTENYKRSSDLATYFKNWQHQVETVVIKNPHIKFTRVVDEDNYYSILIQSQNYNEIKLVDFLKDV